MKSIELGMDTVVLFDLMCKQGVQSCNKRFLGKKKYFLIMEMSDDLANLNVQALDLFMSMFNLEVSVYQYLVCWLGL